MNRQKIDGRAFRGHSTRRIKTTLGELIQAVQEKVPCHEDRMVAETVAHILKRHNAKMVHGDRAGIWENLIHV